MTSHVVVVVLNWNGWQDTVACLRSLLCQNYASFELLVVDNDSADDSVAQIKKAMPGVELLQSGANLGFGGGCNVGIRQALSKDADYVWLINSDATADPHALSALVRVADGNVVLASVGSVLYEADASDQVQLWGGGQVRLWSGQCQNQRAAAPLDFISGASVLMRCAAIEKVGLFDESTFFMYWEDADLSFRLRRAGWQLAVAEDSRVWHKQSASVGKNSPVLDQYFTRSGVRFFEALFRDSVYIYFFHAGQNACKAPAYRATHACPCRDSRVPQRMNDAVPVSVVVPCYRCTRTLERAVESVAAQTSRPLELILVDDGSGDDTIVLLQALADYYQSGWIKIKLLDQNVGAASARNAGWALATQPFIAFLDADDAWHPKKLEIQHGYMRSHPGVLLSGHDHRLLTHNVTPNWEVAAGEVKKISKWALLLSNKFVTPSVMVRSDIKQRFVENQRHMEDHMLWLQIIFNGGGVVKLTSELAAIYKEPFGARGLSAQIWLMERGELTNYRRLLKSGCIGGHEFVAVYVYSILKYVRRLMIYGGYLRWKK